ncbi:hypothetical protein J7432_09200 [Xanthomonas axonopodis pv. begoniae]|nr:hypothetical protein [Xanthomonas axonopodis pv. begoniae]MBO9773029.1 hypothetical protein [Xanthomonas axonopodis pv. begoniae]
MNEVGIVDLHEPRQSTSGFALGHILDQTRGDGYSRTMEYDARDRLRVAASPSFGGTGSHRYTYDAQDNLRTHVTGDTSYEYYYDGANRLTNLMNAATGASVVGLSYDVQGNLSNKNGQAYTFSQGNRLRSVALGGVCHEFKVYASKFHYGGYHSDFWLR